MKIKKILSALLIAAMCLGTVPAGVFAEEEAVAPEAPVAIVPDETGAPEAGVLPEGEALTDDGFQYKINEAGNVTITRYKGDASELVIPASIDGKRVSTIAYGAFSNNEKLTSVVIEEGVGALENSAFYNCANLAKIDLPSTITSIGYGVFSNCALTNTDGFKKLTNLKENTYLPLQNNQITDLSGLKGLPLYGIYLNYNADLKDLSPLVGMTTLNYLFLDGTAVQDEDLWSLYRFDTMKLSLFDIGTQVPLSPRPVVYTDRGMGLNDQIAYSTADPSVASVENGQSLKINKIGETDATAAYNGETRNFKIVVQDMEHAPDAGKPIENLPTLEFHSTPNGTDKLNLKENGELWNISSDTPVLIKEDVKDITTSQFKNKQQSWLFIQDQDDSLWVQETKEGQQPTLEKKLENVAKYVGNNAYDINHKAASWAWVMHKEGGLSQIKTDGTVVAQPFANTKDIANLNASSYYSSNYNYGVTALKEDGTVWTKLASRTGKPENNFEKLASNAVSLTDDNGFIDQESLYHRISVEIQADGSEKVVEKVLADNAAQIFITSNAYGITFYTDKNGASWYQSLNNPPEKIGDMTMAYAPVRSTEYGSNPGESSMEVYYFQDTTEKLWKYKPQFKEVICIDENVAKTVISLGDDVKYLKTDGTFVDHKAQTQTANVTDVLGNYLLMKDGQVKYMGQTILNSVLSINNSDAQPDKSNNYAYSNDCYMTRTDGSVWLHTTGNPSVLTKVANYPEMAPVAVTGVTVAPATLEMTVGDAAKQLTAAVAPADAGNKAVKWSSSDEKIVQVDENGMVTAIGAGKATIIATTVDGSFTANCAVSVNKPIVHVSGVALDKTTIGPMTIGYYETLKATVSPADADNKAVAWSTDNASVAVVDQNGKVTSVGAGEATITATTADGGFKASCKVSVSAPVPEAVTDPVVPDQPTKPVDVSNTEVTITVPAETIQAIPALEGAQLAVKSVNNSSSDEDQAVTQKAVQEVKESIADSAGVADADVLEILDFVFVDPKTGEEVPFDGTQANVTVRLTLKIAPAQKDAYDYFQVYLLNDDGTLGEKIADNLAADSDNKITADARHFSKYMLVGVKKEEVKPGEETPGVPEPGETVPVGTEVKISEPGSNAGTGIISDGHTSAYLCAGMLIVAAAGAAAFAKRRKAR